jgi:hypothetical protein
LSAHLGAPRRGTVVMRLLHFVHPDRLVLTDFHGKSIPQYAILSHRWGGFEILLEDIGSGAYKEKKDGYRKLQFCAEQAAQDKLQYFWIDTCCIADGTFTSAREQLTRYSCGTKMQHDATYSYQTFRCLLRQRRSNAAHGRHPFGQAHGSPEAGRFRNLLRQYLSSSFPAKDGR